ncbi:MAG: hypothetical protein FJX52_12670 [Alphaproteobacteria bacterium]|nr:hypothetical protein [Alphaproteobacteria bacterium]
MRHVLWLLALVAAILWSLLAWGAYAVIGAIGALIAANADWLAQHAERAAGLSWFTDGLTSLGLAGVVAVWLIGLAVIAAAALGLSMAAGRPWRHGAPKVDRMPTTSWEENPARGRDRLRRLFIERRR